MCPYHQYIDGELNMELMFKFVVHDTKSMYNINSVIIF